MLETVRDHAAERLAERADADEIRSRHARYYLALADDGEAGLDGPDWVIWRRRLDAEIDNFRAAFTWLLAARRVESALALASALQPFWRLGWHDREIHGWLSAALSLADDSTPPGARARALLASSRGALLASLRFALLDPESAERDAAAALELYRQLGDQAGIAESLVSLGYRQVGLGRYREAGAIAEHALVAARASGDERAIGWALWLRVTAGEGFDEVRSLAREAVVHFRQRGVTRRIYPLLDAAAYVALSDARYAEALPLLDEALSTRARRTTRGHRAHPRKPGRRPRHARKRSGSDRRPFRATRALPRSRPRPQRRGGAPVRGGDRLGGPARAVVLCEIFTPRRRIFSPA
jgi:tetratricopeptide (TPR) repeat protein